MTSFPEPDFVETNGLRMAVYQRGTGFPVVLCHGFPELAFSWRHQIPALAAAGYRVIAPDQRGYGATPGPAEIEAYDIFNLTGDLTGLLDAFDIEKAVICGHDWGAAVAWNMPLLHPDRVAGVIGLNVPFRPRTPEDPIELARRALGEDMYIVQFQKPGRADAELDADVARSFRFFMRKTRRQGRRSSHAFEIRNLELLRLFRRPEEDWPGQVFLNQEDLNYYVEVFTRSGFTGPLNWYRNITRNWEMTEGLSQLVNVPCLMICAENDVVLPPSLADGMDKYCPDLETHVVADCGHWTQQEQPDEVNRLMTDWLTRRFPPADREAP